MELLLILLAFSLSFSVVIAAIPPIIRTAKVKHLFEPFEERKIHSTKVPSLGGVAIFIGFILSSIIATDGLSFSLLKYIIAAVIVIFFLGLKDDLIGLSARKKLFIQTIAVLFLIVLGQIRFTSLHGILGVYQINYLPSFTLTFFAMIVIINAFNLIDGIDGLASGLGILASAVMGIWFYLSTNTQYSILSFALVGSLSGFFIFNVFCTKYKLFMGDTGSMIIGIVISILVVKFNEFNLFSTNPFALNAAPSISFAIIIVPLIDTLRVMTIRILQNRSPFSPDKNHIHHKLLLVYPNHLKVTLIIVFTNAAIIALAFLLGTTNIKINIQFLCIFVTGVILSMIPSILLANRKWRKKYKMAVR